MNLLLLDDEPLALQNTLQQLRSISFKDGEIFTAGSADAARQILKEHEVQIFLCDIVMPQEDGITFAKKTLQIYPDSKFIFLTAHSDYEYMKAAISMQSFDYILKPVDIEELKSVIERAMLQIALERKNKEILRTKSILMDQETLILEGNAIRYLTGASEDDRFLRESIIQRSGEITDDAVFLPFYIRVLRSEKVWKEPDRELLRSIYYNIIDEVTEPLGAVSILFLRGDTSGSVLSGNVYALLRFRESEKRELAAAVNCLETLRVLFQKLVHTDLVIYCGNYCKYENLREMTESIMDEMGRIVRNVSSVYRTGIGTKQNQGYSFDVQVNSWRSLLNRGRIMDFKNSLFQYLDFHISRNDVDRDFLVKFHQQISELILTQLAVHQINSADLFNEGVSYYDFMFCFRDLELFGSVIRKVLSRMQSLMGSDNEDLIGQTIRYIHDNIDQDLGVAELSEMVGISPEYFTKLFKRHTGMNLKRYIVNEKMEAAKVLLSTTTLPVTIISEHVGYSNYSNFTHTFKQYFDCTPSEYRTGHKTEDQ